MAEEREHRSSAPAHATGAVQFVALDDVAPDETFRLRPDGDVSELATSIGRLGQLAPVDLRRWTGAASDGPQWQVVSGFRRIAAARLLARDRVLARLHRDLGEGDAWGLALGEALLHEPLGAAELEALRERLERSGIAPWAEELVDEALVRAPVAAELRERFYEFLSARPTESVAPTELATPSGGQAAPRNDDECSQPFAPSVAPPEAARGRRAATPNEDDERSEPFAPSVALPEGARSRGAATPNEEDERSEPFAPSVALPEAARSRGAPIPDPIPTGPDEVVEVTPEELVQDLAARLSALNQDLATAVEAWNDLPGEGRRVLVEQARYVAALLPFMEAQE